VSSGTGTITRTSGLKPVTSADYVNTFAGTAHSRWIIAPGPWMPFSMVKLSPDNQNTGWKAGYQPSYESIGMFSHVHEKVMVAIYDFTLNFTMNNEFNLTRQKQNL
jgi:putative alpha-1,2-mannosidase